MRAPQETTPTEIRNQGGECLRLVWQDGHESAFEAAYLRGLCPCASCVDEISGERRYGSRDVPAGTTMASTRLVGNYAVQIDWSDGHTTGIYSFDYLRQICPCESCRGSV